MSYSFVIQQNADGLISPDAATIAEAVQQYNWISGDTDEILLSSNMEQQHTYQNPVIPIGSIEFTEYWLKKLYGVSHIKPIDILKNYKNFLGRRAEKVTGTSDKSENRKILQQLFDRFDTTELFFKDATVCKPDFCPRIMSFRDAAESLTNTTYFVSSVLSIRSEWRVFV